jgi:hypothetical protein
MPLDNNLGHLDITMTSLPNSFILGAAKAGSTTLKDILR